MCEKIDAVEVFRIGEKVERDGALFYQRAAQLFDEGDVKAEFIKLADWELGHERQFALMRERLGREGYEVKSTGGSEYRVLAGLNVFAIGADPAARLHAGITTEEVVKTAVCIERDTIVYYEGLKNFAMGDIVRDNLNVIISEEKQHVEILERMIHAES